PFSNGGPWFWQIFSDGRSLHSISGNFDNSARPFSGRHNNYRQPRPGPAILLHAGEHGLRLCAIFLAAGHNHLFLYTDRPRTNTLRLPVILIGKSPFQNVFWLFWGIPFFDRPEQYCAPIS